MKRLAIAGAVVLVAGAAAAGAAIFASAAARQAAAPAAGTTLTGCINSGGELKSLAVGASPRKACEKNETLVHLGDGDITAVKAGTGLQGGADSGDATLSIDPSYIKVQQLATGDAHCANGGVAILIGLSQPAFACNGETGPQGPKGDTGPQGAKGDTGATGPAGTFENASSPNGVFTVSLTDAGIVLHGPMGDVTVDYDGAQVTQP